MQRPAQLSVRKFLLLQNPNSGGGGGWDTDSFLAAARELGIEVRHERPDDPAICVRLLREAQEVDAVGVAGGDGTLSPLIECLVERKLPLLVLPAGTANDFARSLGMPENVFQLAALLREGRISEVDVGYANDKPFLNAASIGMTNTISRLQTKERKRRWGVLSYAISAIEAGLKSRSFRAIFEDGYSRREMRCIQLLVGNGRFYGGGMTVHTDATLTDGTLHLYAAVPRSIFGMAALLPFLRFGRTDLAPEVFCEEGAEISITTHPKRHVFADGEEITETPVRFRVARAALTVIVPRERTS
ncbi:diacylglycerol kinase catalytic region [Parvibaculum lavamentivorans DS-1]|uniref:Diacylglycerol kinase catalytic region n=1 Tax=Parvibaculum lavamentivorans (strain DS-1 / DSM 13023 / NCIMB 13966) TaxID=402881 RepID=A7HTH6_PARL1|nr:YegS/Rv2252/BmrU family lipid kinase [Parvibaculum lavamentivorans]ABS63209.1 diacylglycerol kinase catalytic region [Parvibaculum lavamentivorans DS-1]